MNTAALAFTESGEDSPDREANRLEYNCLSEQFGTLTTAWWERALHILVNLDLDPNRPNQRYLDIRLQRQRGQFQRCSSIRANICCW